MEDFERSVRNKLENARLDDLMPEFDKEQEWTALTGKMQRSRKIPLPFVWSHAACIVLGALLGFWAISNRQPVPATVVKNTPFSEPVSVPEKVQNNQPLPGKKENTGPQVMVKKETVYKIVTTTVHDTVLLTQYVSGPADSSIKVGIYETPEQAVAKTVITRPPVLHMLDIENEDRKYLINEGYNGNVTGVLGKIYKLIANPRENVVTNDRPLPVEIIFRK